MPTLSDVILSVTRDKATAPGGTPKKKINIIEFVESAWGLNHALFPVQRIILKAHYGIPLDDVVVFQVSMDFRRQTSKDFTEKTYLEYLFDKGWSNIREVKAGEERREMVLSVGRRSGKTTLAACISAYETYKLLLKGSPQKYYGLPPGNNIQIISVATDKDQAALLYNDVSSHYRNCGFFAQYTANNTQTYARFQTPADIEKYGAYSEDQTAKATIKITFRSCIAKGLRGAGNIVIIMDEMAHFTDNGQSSAEEVYKAVVPSGSAFSPKDAKNRAKSIGDNENRVISISSPLGCQGQFYKLFQEGMSGGETSKNMLCIQAPTWEVNPSIAASELIARFIKDPTAFDAEYGANFTDRTKGWIEHKEDLEACIDKTRRPALSGPPRQPHFMGLDIGLVGDGSACAIGHIDSNRIVLDYMGQLKAGEGDYVNAPRLDFDAVADWVYDLSRKFYIADGMFDHWAGIPFEQALNKRGLKQVHTEQMTRQLNSDIFKNFKNMMWAQQLVLYDTPIEPGNAHCAYIKELLELQEEMVSKYVTIVQAPNIEGKHDDRSDALVRMVWMASQRLGKVGTILRGQVSSVTGPAFGNPSRVQLAKAMRHARMTGSSPDRQPGRFSPGRIRGRGI